MRHLICILKARHSCSWNIYDDQSAVMNTVEVKLVSTTIKSSFLIFLYKIWTSTSIFPSYQVKTVMDYMHPRSTCQICSGMYLSNFVLIFFF